MLYSCSFRGQFSVVGGTLFTPPVGDSKLRWLLQVQSFRRQFAVVEDVFFTHPVDDNELCCYHNDQCNFASNSL